MLKSNSVVLALTLILFGWVIGNFSEDTSGVRRVQELLSVSEWFNNWGLISLGVSNGNRYTLIR